MDAAIGAEIVPVPLEWCKWLLEIYFFRRDRRRKWPS